MLDVFVQQLQLVTLLAQFDSQQVSNGEHADPAFTVYDR
jgi:hypothetical protein